MLNKFFSIEILIAKSLLVISNGCYISDTLLDSTLIFLKIICSQCSLVCNLLNHIYYTTLYIPDLDIFIFIIICSQCSLVCNSLNHIYYTTLYTIQYFYFFPIRKCSSVVSSVVCDLIIYILNIFISFQLENVAL